MIRVYPNEDQDVMITVTFDDSISDFTLEFFTDKEAVITKTKNDLVDNICKIDAEDLNTLASGVLRCFAKIKYNDSDYKDGTFDDVQFIQTDFYIKK